jgi:hypothetical protein
MAKAPTFYACMFDWELSCTSWFHKGTKEECEEAAKKMAECLGVEVTSEVEIEEDKSEANNRPLVTSKRPPITCITKVQKAKGDAAYGGGDIMVGYPATAKEDNCFFQPYKPSEFKVGDRVILAQFHASAPGGWTVVNLDMTRKEYWQEGYISDTE